MQKTPEKSPKIRTVSLETSSTCTPGLHCRPQTADCIPSMHRLDAFYAYDMPGNSLKVMMPSSTTWSERTQHPCRWLAMASTLQEALLVYNKSRAHTIQPVEASETLAGKACRAFQELGRLLKVLFMYRIVQGQLPMEGTRPGKFLPAFLWPWD